MIAALWLRTFWSTVDVLFIVLRSANLHNKINICFREKTEDVREAVNGHIANWVILSLSDDVT